MKSIHQLLIAAGLLISLPWLASAQRSASASATRGEKQAVLTPGPENGGLTMKMTLTPPSTLNAMTRVDIEITNVSDKPVTLRGDLESDEENGGFTDYLESAISIETLPAIEPWSGQVMVGRRTCPQPGRTLKAGESLSLSWQTDGKHLKNRVSNPLTVQDPVFPVPGLYSVHAVLNVSTGGEPLLLRSNEQLFPAGGSHALPKSTYGQVREVSANDNTALINLGSLLKVQHGDQFRIRTGYSDWYRLSITKTEPEWSTGTLFPELPSADASRPIPFPKVGQGVTLADSKMPVPSQPAESAMMDRETAAKVPVVLRVEFISEGNADKYGWSKVRLAATLKNESKHTFPDEFEIAHLSTQPGVPAGVSTVYLERYHPDKEDLWKLLGGSAATGSTHSAKP